MQRLRVGIAGVVAAAVLAAGLSLAGYQAQAGDKDGKLVTILLKDVKVKDKNAKGEHWDAFEGKPDLRVYMKNLSDKTAKDFSSETSNDTFYAKCNVPTLSVREGQAVEIHIYDVDIAFNDLAGKTKLVITPEHVAKGSHELSFGQVSSLRLVFQTAKAK